MITPPPPNKTNSSKNLVCVIMPNCVSAQLAGLQFLARVSAISVGLNKIFQQNLLQWAFCSNIGLCDVLDLIRV